MTALLYLIQIYIVVDRFKGSGFKVQGSGFGVQGSGFRVQGSGFKVQGCGSGFAANSNGALRAVPLRLSPLGEGNGYTRSVIKTRGASIFCAPHLTFESRDK